MTERAYGAVGPRPAVRRSIDLDRIVALPRREPVERGSARAEALVELMTARLRRPDRALGSPCGCAAMGRRFCIDRLLWTQAWALYEIGIVGGCIAPIGVGGGKTVLDVLAAMVVPGCRVAALFVPPRLVDQLWDDYRAIAEHFAVPSFVLPDGRGMYIEGRPVVHVVPYSRFSRKAATDYLRQLRPDTFLADEVHRFKHLSSVGTGRFARYFAEAEETPRLCGWSGSIVSHTMMNVQHLSAFALKEGSPLPLDPDVAQEWASHVDPSDWPAPAGSLRVLAGPAEEVRPALARRLRETLGWVTAESTSSLAGCSLILRERELAAPKSVLEAIREVRTTWTRPDGEEFVEALDVTNCVEQLALGFYYRWRFPGNPDPEIIAEWFAARKAWNKELRAALKQPKEHLDSPELLQHAAERALRGYDGPLPVWESDTWARWRDVKDTIAHETEAVWIDDFAVRDAAGWARDEGPGVLWYKRGAFGRAVAKLAELPLFSGGKDAERRLKAVDGKQSAVVSINSFGTGFDGLQFVYDKQIVYAAMPSGDAWEQLLGREHRQGQPSDEVATWVLRHTADFRDAIDRALELSKFIEGFATNNQRLLVADVEFDWHRGDGSAADATHRT